MEGTLSPRDSRPYLPPKLVVVPGSLNVGKATPSPLDTILDLTRCRYADDRQRIRLKCVQEGKVEEAGVIHTGRKGRGRSGRENDDA